ncbi:hypothetical protein C8R44DRAFT_869738 [Mycena epipterygia]|nr:hypothetical protein C8R44DRAFT_869738 [Mycena epipterygia]
MSSYWSTAPPCFVQKSLEFDASRGDTRWADVVKWWSVELSTHQYDGVIGLSQGSAMAALLLSMLKYPERVPNFKPAKKQDFKFGIFCSGFISPHAGIPDIPTLHTLDDHDTVVRAARTLELQEMCTIPSFTNTPKVGPLKQVDDPELTRSRAFDFSGRELPDVVQDFILDSTK